MSAITRPNRRSRISRGAVVAYLWVVCIFVLLPVVYAFVGAVQSPSSLSRGIFGVFTSLPTLENFETAFRTAPLLRQMLNSVVATVAETLLVVITSLLFAYALVFGRMRGKRILFAFALGTMMIPVEGIIVANYLTVTAMGLFDTIVAVFLPFIASAYAIFLFRQAFLTFPRQIHESATLDGVGPLRFLWSFLLPLNLPILFAVAVTTAIGAWNNYMWPLLITQSASSRTVQVGITQLADEANTDIGSVLAGLAVVTLPMIVLVLTSRKFLTKGLTEGSEK